MKATIVLIKGFGLGLGPSVADSTSAVLTPLKKSFIFLVASSRFPYIDTASKAQAEFSVLWSTFIHVRDSKTLVVMHHANGSRYITPIGAR